MQEPQSAEDASIVALAEASNRLLQAAVESDIAGKVRSMRDKIFVYRSGLQHAEVAFLQQLHSAYSLLRHAPAAEVLDRSSRIAQLIAVHSAAATPGSQPGHALAAEVSDEIDPWAPAASCMAAQRRQHGIQLGGGGGTLCRAGRVGTAPFPTQSPRSPHSSQKDFDAQFARLEAHVTNLEAPLQQHAASDERFTQQLQHGDRIGDIQAQLANMEAPRTQHAQYGELIGKIELQLESHMSYGDR